MATQLNRLPSVNDLPARERRREPRYPTNHPICLHMGGIRLCAAWLIDVSPHGCCVHGGDLELHAGAFVSLGPNRSKTGDNAQLEAIVRWVRANAAGLEFLRQVPSNAAFWQNLISSSAIN